MIKRKVGYTVIEDGKKFRVGDEFTPSEKEDYWYGKRMCIVGIIDGGDMINARKYETFQLLAEVYGHEYETGGNLMYRTHEVTIIPNEDSLTKLAKGQICGLECSDGSEWEFDDYVQAWMQMREEVKKAMQAMRYKYTKVVLDFASGNAIITTPSGITKWYVTRKLLVSVPLSLFGKDG